MQPPVKEPVTVMIQSPVRQMNYGLMLTSEQIVEVGREIQDLMDKYRALV